MGQTTGISYQPVAGTCGRGEGRVLTLT